MDVEIVQVVFLYQVFGAAHTCRTNIDGRNLSGRPAQSMFGRRDVPQPAMRMEWSSRKGRAGGK